MRSAFGTGSVVRKPYERSLYERTFMSEPFIEKHAISTELCNVNREKHKLKSHRVCRRDREPSRIPIRGLKSLRNKSRKVREFVHARILSCFSMSFTLYCYVNAKSTFKKRSLCLTVVVDLVKVWERYKISQSLSKIVGINYLWKGRTHSFCRCLFRNEYLITGVKLETPKNASHVDSFSQYDYSWLCKQ